MVMVNGAGPYASHVVICGATAAASASALSESVTTPTGNKGALKPFFEVILDARAALDAGYKRLGKIGDSYTTGADWRETVGLGNIDRRALFAISSNQGGLFSTQEVMVAITELGTRQWEAMAKVPVNDYNHSARLKASNDYLDAASPEEKASLKWAQDRATSQMSYMLHLRDEGRAGANTGTGDTLADLFLKSMEELVERLRATNDFTGEHTRLEDMPSYQIAMDYWEMRQQAKPPLSWTL